MAAGIHQLFTIAHSSDISAARRAGAALAAEAGFKEATAGKLAIVITEAATNIIKHAVSGRILLRVLQRDGVSGVEVLALDNGPGIVNLSQSLLDGISTAGTPGNGLGAMRRLCHDFDAYSLPGSGAAFYMRIWATAAAPAPEAVDYGVVCLPLPSEQACGDAWSVRQDKRAASFMVVDGLGHGPAAALAAQYATETFEARTALAPADMIDAMHVALRPTRGAALAVSTLRFDTGEMRFAGVGNISACLEINGAPKQFISHNGIVGHNVRKVQEFVLPCQDGALYVMNSDGLGRQWNIDAYRGLRLCHPALIAGVLYRDFSRGRDDVTVLVARIGRLD